MPPRRSRDCCVRKALLLVAAATILAIVLFGRLALPFFGRFLTAEDPIRKADAIVVLGGGRIGRSYEAALLYRRGIAPLILLSHPDDSGHYAATRQLHVRIPTDYDLQVSALQQLGVPSRAVHDLPGKPRSTEDEAALIARACRQRSLRSVIVVSSPYHMRRARLYMRDAAEGRFTVTLRASSFEGPRPERWWQQPSDRTDVVLEWLKLPVCIWKITTRRGLRSLQKGAPAS